MRETGAKLPEGFVYIGEDMSSVFFGNSKIRTTDLMWVFGRNEFFYQHKKPENKSPHLVIRRGNMKLLLHSLDDRIELYDLRKDPYEQRNLVEKYPALVKELSERVIHWWNDRMQIRINSSGVSSSKF